MEDILKAPYIKEIARVATYMYSMGWDDRNAGNISYLLKEEDVLPYIDINKVIKEIEISLTVKELAGKYFLITGTGKYFRNIECDPEDTLGIIRVSADGRFAELVWGYKNGGSCTCELSAHLMSHAVRLKVDATHRTVIHTHPIYILAMDGITDCDEKEFTKKLWQTHTEAIAVYPDGLGYLPCMVNGTADIAKFTAEKLKKHRLVMWSNHGIYGTGGSMDETFGLIETVEKTAHIYVLKAGHPIHKVIPDEVLLGLAKQFNVTPEDGILNQEK